MVSIFFLATVLSLLHSGLAINGWTYRTTPETCSATYSSPCGPDYWYKASGASTCSGQSQSPIDISHAETIFGFKGPVPQPLNGGCNTWVQFSTNYTYELAFTDAGFVCNNFQLTYNDEIWSMKQIHVHSPSEHTIAGGYFSAEAHLVHKNTAGDILVLGVFLQAAADHLVPRNNSFFQLIWNKAGSDVFTGVPTEVEDSDELLNPYEQILPGRSSFYHYSGSLTTPPCSENVQWFVFDEPVQISSYDLDTLRKAIGVFPTNILSENGNDNRPTLPLHGRSVIYSNGEVFADDDDYTGNDDDGDIKITKSIATAAIVIAAVTFALVVYGVYLVHGLYSKYSELFGVGNAKQKIMPVGLSQNV